MPMSEEAVQSHTRRDFAYIGPIWRNNSGMLYNQEGVPVRYGLGNDSAQVNKRLKSSDLIGITPVMITGDMIGQIVGVFTALEIKHEGWTLKPSDQHAQAQLRWMEIVKANGGFAGFVNHPSQINAIIGR